MGVGNYSERDVRECARAFTGWYFDDLAFKVDPAKHDGGAKTFLGRTGNFDGVEVLKIIFEQPVTAEYLAGKIYRFLVRDELSPDLRRKLGAVLREHDYEVKPLLTVIFSSKDFYSQASYGGHIKGPVEHLVAMMKHLGADAIPGVPDFNQSTIAMGQHLLNPPSVAGWAGGKAWITPGLLIARGNVARDVLIPDMTGFRDWNFTPAATTCSASACATGYDVGAATAVNDPSNMSTFDMVALERDERFNTRISGYVGWQQAARKLIPTPRRAAQFDLTHDGARQRREDDGGSGRLPALAAAPRAGGEGHQGRARDVPDQGVGDGQRRSRQDLHGRRATHDRASDHEHARVSDRLTAISGRLNQLPRQTTAAQPAAVAARAITAGARSASSPT